MPPSSRQVFRLLAGSKCGGVSRGERCSEHYIWPAMVAGANLVFQIIRADRADDTWSERMVFLQSNRLNEVCLHFGCAGCHVEFELFFGRVLGCGIACDHDWNEFPGACFTDKKDGVGVVVKDGVGWVGGGNGSQ